MSSRTDGVLLLHTLRNVQAVIQWWEFPSQSISDICYEINDQLEAFIHDFKFLTLFAGCIRYLSNGMDPVPHLASIAVKIEATMQEIANEVRGKEVQSFTTELKEMEEDGSSFEERASKMLLLFINFEEKINLLKPEIREASEDLQGQSFHCCCPPVRDFSDRDSKDLLGQPLHCYCPMRDFADWELFMTCFLTCITKVKDEFDSDDFRKIQVQDLWNKLYCFHSLLYGLPHILRAQQFSVYVVNVIIRSAFVSCHWWSSQFSPTMKEEVIIALLKLTSTDPKSLDQILRLLKSSGADDGRFTSKEKVTIFVQYLLPSSWRFPSGNWQSFWPNENGILPTTFIKELETLTISVVKNLNIKEEDPQDEQIFFPDFKLLISVIGESFPLLPENGTLLFNLLEKVWLMKMEVFIMDQLTAGDGLLKKTNTLDIGVVKIKQSAENTESLNQILMLMKELAKVVPGLHHSFGANDITIDVVRILLLLLLIKILLFKLDRKLQDYNGSSLLTFKDTVQSYLEGSKFLISCVLKQRVALEEEEVEVAQIETMASKVISVCHSFPALNITEEMIENMNLMLSDLRDEIKVFMLKLRAIYLPFPTSNFPMTNASGFCDALLNKLKELLLNCNSNFFVSVKQQIEEVLADLEFFRYCLGDILELAKEETQELRYLCRDVIDVAYEAENLIDSIVHGIESEWHNLIWLYDLLQNVRYIRTQVTKVHEKKTYGIKGNNVPRTSRQMDPKASNPRIDDIILSLNDQQEVIIDKLVGDYQPRDIVSIVGMPGIGKTTLAKKVYSSPIVVHHFHIRAWCCVTEIYKKRELLLEILSQIIVLTDNILGMSGEDLEFKLRQLLLKKKYLIVIDDIWSPEAWDDFQTSFPDDGNGSRILITSRLNDVALKAKAQSDAHHVRLLSNVESWHLLQMRIFCEECCPEELIKVGQEIAERCKGLPLGIVAMAGLLKRIDRQQSQWKEIAENLRSGIVDPQEQCGDILELSYKFLPDHLKACFLYFAAFLEDKEIAVTKLIRLWVAEGFVPRTEFKSLEDLAEDYLKDLIGRNLVIFAEPRSRGGTKACRVHDMLRSFCQTKATEDNFLRLITMSNESYASFDDIDFLVDDNVSNPSNYKTYEDHRLCFYVKRNHFIESRPSGPLVRSLLFFGMSDKYARSSYDVSFISYNFRRLKVLDLECINVGPSFPKGINLMMELKYLAVSGDVDSVPSSIANISNLETLIVKGLKGKVKLPDTIWYLKSLRHLLVTDAAVINLKDNKLDSSSLLDSLVTLASPFIRIGKGTNNMLRKFPNLRKLGCIFSGSHDSSGAYNHFPSLDVLTQLESLKISYHGRALDTALFGFPSSLKKLTLSNFRLPWSEISVIGSLKRLEVLKLLSRAYDGEIWYMVEGEFENLKFLKLDNLNIAKWVASSYNLPNLEKLVLRNCKHLKEVPSSFVEISTLQMIEVQWCGKSAEESVRRMRYEADEYLKVIITSDLDS